MALHILKAMALAAVIFSTAATADTAWAQFCDDNACTVNCGESVDFSNPGCLNEAGRNSILFHGGVATGSLVFSPTPDCPCQNDCIVIDEDPDECGGDDAECCLDLNGNMFAESFRFIGSACDPDNC